MGGGNALQVWYGSTYVNDFYTGQLQVGDAVEFSVDAARNVTLTVTHSGSSVLISPNPYAGHTLASGQQTKAAYFIPLNNNCIPDGSFSGGQTTSFKLPPLVNAGPTQNKFSNEVLQLSGTASDDVSVASTTWSLLSGPNEPPTIITNPNNLSTTVTGLAQGAYVFQLSATDNEGYTAASTVTVNVMRAPAAPTAPAYPQAVQEADRVILTCNLTFTNNLYERHGYGGIHGGQTPEGNPSVAGWFQNPVIRRNLIADIPASVKPQLYYPADNFYPGTESSPVFNAQFVDFSQGNFTLAATSPGKGTATDGTDVGANIQVVQSLTAGCMTGLWQGGPSSSPHSLSVNGTTAYVSVPNSTSINITSAITVEAWVKTNTSGGLINRIVSRYNDVNGGYILDLYQNKARFMVVQDANHVQYATGSTVLAPNVWYHLAGVADGSEIRVYVNGVKDGFLASSWVPYTGTDPLYLGASPFQGVIYFPWNGLIDEVRVTSGVLYNASFTPQSHLPAGTGTKALWKFDGLTMNDFSSNGNNGTAVGGATFSTDVP